MVVPGCGSDRVVGELVPGHVELASDEIHDGRRHELARSQQAARVAEHAQLQGEAQLVAGASPDPDVLKVLVVQGVVAQQVRLALWQGKQSQTVYTSRLDLGGLGWSSLKPHPFKGDSRGVQDRRDNANCNRRISNG